MPEKVYLDDEGNPISGGKPPTSYINEAEEVAAPPPAAPPGVMGLIGNFLGGAEGGAGGLKDIIPDLPGLVHMVTSPFETARGIAQKSWDQYNESMDKGRGGLLSTATAIPLIGPAAAKAGESIGTGDPRKIAAGLGSATAQLLPFGLGRTAAKLPGLNKVGPAIENIAGNGVVKSYARALAAPSEKLRLAAREVAPTLAGKNLTAVTLKGLSRKLDGMLKEAGEAVDANIQFHGQAPVDVAKVIKRIEDLRTPHLNPRSVGTANPVTATPEGDIAVATNAEIVDKIKENLGPSPTVSDLYWLKKQFDHMVTKGGNEKMYSEFAKSGKLSYYKEAANTLRDMLNDVHTDVETANKNFSDIAKAKTIMRATLKKRDAKEVAPAGGIPGGFGAHTTLPGVVVKAAQAIKLKASPLWNTLNGAAKETVRKSLATGTFGPDAEAVLAASTLLKPSDAKPKYFPGLKLPEPTPPPVQTPSGLIAEQLP